MPLLACALILRLPLVAALGDSRSGELGRPLALAPEPGAPQAIGVVSGPAEAFGVRRGMRLAEALARCPGLVLVPPDPARADALWERALRRLEGIGAAVEPGRPGEAFFSLDALRAIHGGPEAALSRARRALGPPAKLGGGPTRLLAHAAATRARARRRPPIVSAAASPRVVAALPVSALSDALAWRGGHAPTASGDWQPIELPATLERLGVRTLGELAALPADAVADRFGEPGLRALRLARGADEPLRPRHPPEEIVERLGLPGAASGTQLSHALGLLVDRLLANPARRGRSIRRLRIEARLAAAGGWRVEVALRHASASAEHLRLALTPRLETLPGPASVLALRALELGPEPGDQAILARSPAEERRGRLAEAVRQTRAAAGRDALLRVVEVDPDSRLPERRALLTPFPEEDGA